MADPFEVQLQAMFDEAPAASDAAPFAQRVEAAMQRDRRRHWAVIGAAVVLVIVGLSVSLAGPGAHWAGLVEASLDPATAQGRAASHYMIGAMTGLLLLGGAMGLLSARRV